MCATALILRGEVVEVGKISNIFTAIEVRSARLDPHTGRARRVLAFEAVPAEACSALCESLLTYMRFSSVTGQPTRRSYTRACVTSRVAAAL